MATRFSAGLRHGFRRRVALPTQAPDPGMSSRWALLQRAAAVAPHRLAAVADWNFARMLLTRLRTVIGEMKSVCPICWLVSPRASSSRISRSRSERVGEPVLDRGWSAGEVVEHPGGRRRAEHGVPERNGADGADHLGRRGALVRQACARSLSGSTTAAQAPVASRVRCMFMPRTSGTLG